MVVVDHLCLCDLPPKKLTISLSPLPRRRGFQFLTMETYIILLILSFGYSIMALNQDAGTHFDVMDFGAIGDGETDDSQAFLKAWRATCNSHTNSSTMVIPKTKANFLLLPPVTFQGPCKSRNVLILVIGNIIAPESIHAWKGLDPRGWLTFRRVNGLMITGWGLLNGRGKQWWRESCRYNTKAGCIPMAPTVLRFISCSRVRIKGLRLLDSPNTHMLIEGSRGFNVREVYISAPEDSPNTDGVHVHASRHIHFEQLAIGTGDDCISIGDRTSDIRISRIGCGPGHGISIGSLGKDSSSKVAVSNIHVRDVHFYGTTNGARIKTWQGAHGYARNISFESLKFTWVDNPIIIDQYYCNISRSCKNQTEGVKISDVSYRNSYGTSSTNVAINLMCSETVPCTGIHVENIRLASVGEKLQSSAYCLGAHGSSSGSVIPNVPCLGRA